MNTVMTGCHLLWPRYPMETPGGKISMAKKAGKQIPWLSANVVGNLSRREHRALHHMWRDAALEAFAHQLSLHGQGPDTSHATLLDVHLVRPRQPRMDAFAILEGMKPIVDAMVLAGLLPDDTPRYVQGGIATAGKAEVPGLHILFRPPVQGPTCSSNAR